MAPKENLTFQSRLTIIERMIRLPKRSNLATQITEGLFDAILRGELKPGEQIIETKMAKQLGVGQSTFREALQALEHRGLVTKNRNTFVTELTVQDVEVLFAVRLELEPLAASLACGRLTGAQIRHSNFASKGWKRPGCDATILRFWRTTWPSINSSGKLRKWTP